MRNIIFDFGGVILKHKSTIIEEMLAKIFSLPVEQAREIWQEEKPLIMAGKVSSRDFLQRLKGELCLDKPLDEIFALWQSLYAKEAEDVDWKLLEFIEQLKSRFNVYLFTDTIDTNDEHNATRGIYNKFTRVFKSNKEGFTKQNDNAFLNVLQKISAKPEDCIFIDDLEVNVARAERLSIKGILYTNTEILIEELGRLGISV